MSIPSQHEVQQPHGAASLPPDGAPLGSAQEAQDAAEFDLDAWIGSVARREVTVPLWNPDEAWTERYDMALGAYQLAEARLRKAEKDAEDGAERSVTDTTASDLEAEVIATAEALTELQKERDAKALLVRLQERTPDELATSHKRGREEGAGEFTVAYAVADAIVSMQAPDGRSVKPFTAGQLLALIRRDVSGHQQFVQLRQRLEEISARPSVPSWPGSSTSRGTGGSAAR